MMSFTPLQVNRGYERKIKRAGTLPNSQDNRGPSGDSGRGEGGGPEISKTCRKFP